MNLAKTLSEQQAQTMTDEQFSLYLAEKYGGGCYGLKALTTVMAKVKLRPQAVEPTPEPIAEPIAEPTPAPDGWKEIEAGTELIPALASTSRRRKQWTATFQVEV